MQYIPLETAMLKKQKEKDKRLLVSPIVIKKKGA